MSNTTNHMSNNRSKTGDGHQMSKIDAHNELAKQERELINAHKGIESSCGKCGEQFRMSNLKHTLRDAIILDEHLLAGGCPGCNSWKTAHWHKNRNNLLQMTFEINGHKIETLRIPMGFKAMVVKKVDEKGRELLK